MERRSQSERPSRSASPPLDEPWKDHKHDQEEEEQDDEQLVEQKRRDKDESIKQRRKDKVKDKNL